MIKNIIIGFLFVFCVLAFTFAAYQKSEAELQREHAVRQAQLANELRYQIVKMEVQLDSLKNQAKASNR